MATVAVQTQHRPVLPSTAHKHVNLDVSAQHISAADARLADSLALTPFPPVNQNGSFEFDRVIKSGYVQKRTQKTKAWKSIYLVLRPNTLYIYRSEQEEKLRHKIYLSDLTAVTLLKDPKQKRPNVFGLFSPAKNYHLQASTLKDAKEWVDLVRRDARIEEEEEELLMASPLNARSMKRAASEGEAQKSTSDKNPPIASSPDAPQDCSVAAASTKGRRPSQIDSSGLSGAEALSHSDFSDSDMPQPHGTSIGQPTAANTWPMSIASRPGMANRKGSQVSGLDIERDPDRVVWQGRLYLHRSKGGVRQWKKSWAVLRPRNFILYKDESEYSVSFIVYLTSIVNVVDIDPVSKAKKHCLQIITDEKSYRFCADDEETLIRCMGAYKSLLAKRRELEAKAAAAAGRVTSTA